MAKSENHLDVLVLGEHPATYLTAMLLRHKSDLRIIHATIPQEHVPDRLVLINPAFFALHKSLESLKRKLDLTTFYGLRFLADEADTESEHKAKSTLAYVGTYKQIRLEMAKIAAAEGVEFMTPKTLQIHRLDEKGVDVTAGKTQLRPTLLVVGGELPVPQQKLIGLPESWGPDVIHRYTFLKLRGTKGVDLGGRPTIPMSLDLGHQLCWAWLMEHDGQVQVAVEQPVETISRIKPRELLHKWIDVLRQHGVMKAGSEIPMESSEWMDLPMAGALAHEGVANRTLLVGPAGGFYSASGEDIYPNCWSAVFAADVIKKALEEPHLQDALQPYRQKWRTTLGDYLRGPQQNLRFLLPLVYRNPFMTTRLAESVLLGKSLHR